MGLIEDIGEATIRMASRTYRLFAGLVKKLRKFSIYPFFKNRGIDQRDYTVLKAQVGALLFLFFSVVYVFGFISGRAYAASLLIGVYPVLLFSKLREFYHDDYPAYRDFFLGYITIALLLVIIKTVKPLGHPIFPNLHLVVFSILYITAFSYFFKKKYGRNYTYGKVIEGGSPARVKLHYDLRASVKPAVALLENDAGVKEGDIVVLEVDSSVLNLRGRKALRILRRWEGESS